MSSATDTFLASGATSLKALSQTYVLYDPAHRLAQPLALLTLSPFFLFSAYATLILINRPLSVVNLLVGQLGNEGINYILKESWKADRPGLLGDGYGMPSSHSQFVAYSSTFMILHITFIQDRVPGGRITSYRSKPWPTIQRHVLRSGLIFWSLAVGYSRYYLRYHSPPQVIVGLGVGALIGATHFLITEAIPFWYPNSTFAKLRASISAVWRRWPFDGFGGFGPGGGVLRDQESHVIDKKR